VLFLAVMAFMLSHLGQDCTISCNPPPPPSCLMCKGGQVVVCDQFCATPRQVTQSCNYAFPCDPNDLRQCDTGLVCVANPKGTDGTCRPDTLLQPCSLLGLHCGSPEYCRESDLCGGTQSLCALPLQAGLPCQPDDPCGPCAPGLTCYVPPNSTGLPLPGTCVLAQPNPNGAGTCTSNTQCNNCAGDNCLMVTEDVSVVSPGASATSFGLITEASGNVTAGGQCRSCAQGLHTACSQQTPCCTPGQECSFMNLPLTTSGTCCEAIGSPCPDGITDCCGGITKCRATSSGAVKTCEECANDGEYCTATADCCSGNGTKCIGNKCTCAGPGSTCSSAGGCCSGDVCGAKVGTYPRVCEACPVYLNPCVTNGDCCGGGSYKCCLGTGPQTTCQPALLCP